MRLHWKNPVVAVITLPLLIARLLGQELKVLKCGGKGMDISVSGPFQGVVGVKNSPCQIEIRVDANSPPVVFFVPYGTKCGANVDSMGRASFNLVTATQRLLPSSAFGRMAGYGRVYYETEETTVVCKYWISLQDKLRALTGRTPGALNQVADEPLRVPMPLARNLYPIDFFESPVLMIRD